MNHVLPRALDEKLVGMPLAPPEPAPRYRDTPLVAAVDIKPIETAYAGCRFRSRLEARWAVWFDALGIQWHYEPQGFSVGPFGSRRPYLPDFWLPDQKIWVEVKGAASALDGALLIDAAHPAYGLPADIEGHTDAWGLCKLRMLVLGPIPKNPGVHAALVALGGEIVGQQRAIATCMPDHGDQHLFMLIGSPTLARGKHLAKHPAGFDDSALNPIGTGFTLCKHVRDAYRDARSARFEHGESGCTPTAREDSDWVSCESPRPSRRPRKAAAKKRPTATVEALDQDSVPVSVPVPVEALTDAAPTRRVPGRSELNDPPPQENLGRTR